MKHELDLMSTLLKKAQFDNAVLVPHVKSLICQIYPPTSFTPYNKACVYIHKSPHFFLHLFCLDVFFQFLKTLRLKTVIILSSNFLDETVSSFFEQQKIQMIFVENTVSDSLRGLLPFAEEMVTESLKVICSGREKHYPLMVTCKTGKNLTGVVIACLRKMQRWSLVSIYEEYRRFSGGSRLQQQHEQFIELFDTDLVPVKPESAPKFLLE